MDIRKFLWQPDGTGEVAEYRGLLLTGGDTWSSLGFQRDHFRALGCMR
jgi:hypothetical protein